MIGLVNMNRETCGRCIKQIYIGQSSIVCSKCNLIFHLNCAKDAVTFREDIFCSICVDKFDVIRYNPFFHHDLIETDDNKFYDNEPSDYIEIIENMSNILENCRSYTINELNNKLLDTSDSISTGTADASDRFSTRDVILFMLSLSSWCAHISPGLS